MGVFDSDFSNAFQEKSSNNSWESQSNDHESGGLTPDFGINQNDYKTYEQLEFLKDGRGGSPIAQTEYNRPVPELPNHENEDLIETTSRLMLSASVGYLSSGALSLAGLRHIPRIGTPLAIATPFLVAGLTSSYLKTESFTDTRSLAEGALAYGGVCGLRYLGRAIEAPAHIVAPGAKQTISTPIRFFR